MWENLVKMKRKQEHNVKENLTKNIKTEICFVLFVEGTKNPRMCPEQKWY